MSNWPDPEKPGVPLNPERDGYHWLTDPDSDAPHPLMWVADLGAWAVGDVWTPRMVAEMGLHYHGPVLTPAERDALPIAVAGIVATMRVDLSDGYRLAAKVALAALEPADGVFYARDQGEHLNLKRAHHRVKQKLDEAAEAWNINMKEKQ
jgi:hypothetical protein